MFIDELKRMLKNYEIVRVEYKHFNDLYKLQLTYPEYFSTMQKHEVTLEECIEGTKVLPPKTKKNQKHYLGFYKDNKLHAISDIITGFPNESVVWIGLLMIDNSLKRKGLGRLLFNVIKESAIAMGFKSLQIGVLENNAIALEFWKAMNFKEISRKFYAKEKDVHVIVMEYSL